MMKWKSPGVNTTPKDQEAGIVNYPMGGIYGPYGWTACINFRKGLFDWKLKFKIQFAV
jgi:hypothetical protein